MKVSKLAFIDFLLSLPREDKIFIFKQTLNSVSEEERYIIIKNCLNNFSTKNKKKLIKLISSSLVNLTRYANIDCWMEKTFNNHPEYTPYQVAMMGLNYFKMNRQMKPFMLSQARKIKTRIRMRKRRQKDYI